MSIDDIVAVIDKNLISVNDKLTELRAQISLLEDEFYKLNYSRKRLTGESPHSTPSEVQ